MHFDPSKRTTMFAPRYSSTLPFTSVSADVFLHDVGRAHVRLGGLVPGFAQRAPLAQQIPALVELDLDVGEALALRRGGLGVLEQLVLFGDQAFYMSQYARFLCFVFHGDSCWTDAPL